MTVDPPGSLENAPAQSCTLVQNRGLLLSADPCGKILRAVHRHAEQHFGVLRTTILRALAEKDPSAVRVHPHAVGMVRYQVGLARELRNPEAVVRIGREQLQKCRGWMTGVAHRYVQLVGSYDSELGIAKLPPELVTDGGRFQRGCWLGSILD